MKALRVGDSGVELADIPKPHGGRNETLVRVTLSGICNTDLEIARGYAGFKGTIGHEFVGVVEVSDAAPQLNGKRVVGEINAGCGKCEKCRRGDPRHCPGRTVLGIHGRDGAHAEFLTLPASNLIQLPDNISDEAAVFAEPLAAAYGIFENVEVNGDSKVAVIGDGKLGILCARCALLFTQNVTLVGKHRDKLERAGVGMEKLLAGETDATRAGGFDIVIEASGSASGMNSAIRLVRPQGTIVLKSTFGGAAEWDAAAVVVNEITVKGSRCGRLADAVRLLDEGKVDVTDLITEIHRLSDAIRAVERAAAPGTLKVLLKNDN